MSSSTHIGNQIRQPNMIATGITFNFDFSLIFHLIGNSLCKASDVLSIVTRRLCSLSNRDPNLGNVL